MSTPSPARRVERVRHEVRRRELVVVRVEPLSPGFVSLTFAGEALADFVSLSFDDHVKLILPGPSGEPAMRDYTPRRFDRERRELTIEFALHADGVASEWARRAQPGARATIGGPRGSMIVPVDFDWHLLVGDATALPAIHRRLEELPATTRAIVIVQAAHPDERRRMASAAALDLRWVASADDLVAAVRGLVLPDGDGYAWCAGEAATMAALRGVLLNDKHHPKEAARIAAYWKRGALAFHENLEL